ncbi:G2/M phase-specific E3 ubiquitin-protein ligase-like [Perca fluviatilis]|uniref:G2/M phase-specific E3 ubiquitin-protein ligase-like n=1 Tax=Perca fluviatilis TaxID=8168 RepID=UPI0019664195|nr:G2/M phase-specific E3 ubiquitin-protein ligase-like [Perca fluviatilis]
MEHGGPPHQTRQRFGGSFQNPGRDYLANAGRLRPLKRIEDKDLLVEDIIMFQLVHRVSGALQRFREGMKTLGVLDAIRMHPDAFRLLFCHEPSPLTADVLELSAVGRNKRRAEECVVAFWRDYLLDVEEQEGPLQLGGILAFTTGANDIPPWASPHYLQCFFSMSCPSDKAAFTHRKHMH